MLAAPLIGMLFGFFGSIPVAGPVSVIVLGRALEGRMKSGFWIAAGASLAEAAYAFLAFLGMSVFLARYPWIEPLSRAAAAVLLLTLGTGLLLRRNKNATAGQKKYGNKRSFALGFSITALNPTLIATWTAAMAMLLPTGLVHFEKQSALPFSIGVSAGIIAWFAVLLALVRQYKGRIPERLLSGTPKLMGILLLALGVVFALKAAAVF